MTKDELRKMYQDAGWSQEEIEAVEHINEQMQGFFQAINDATKKDTKPDNMGNDLVILS